jgi:hypothetical protein
VELLGKEDLLDTDQSTCAMVVPIAVQQPTVSELVAVAVAFGAREELPTAAQIE